LNRSCLMCLSSFPLPRLLNCVLSCTPLPKKGQKNVVPGVLPSIHAKATKNSTHKHTNTQTYIQRPIIQRMANGSRRIMQGLLQKERHTTMSPSSLPPLSFFFPLSSFLYHSFLFPPLSFDLPPSLLARVGLFQMNNNKK
jgi:hypothetical protein